MLLSQVCGFSLVKVLPRVLLLSLLIAGHLGRRENHRLIKEYKCLLIHLG